MNLIISKFEDERFTRAIAKTAVTVPVCGLPVHNSKENESVKIISDHYIFDEFS